MNINMNGNSGGGHLLPNVNASTYNSNPYNPSPYNQVGSSTTQTHMQQHPPLNPFGGYDQLPTSNPYAQNLPHSANPFPQNLFNNANPAPSSMTPPAPANSIPFVENRGSFNLGVLSATATPNSSSTNASGGALLEFDPFAKRPLSPKSKQQQSMRNAAELSKTGVILDADRNIVKELILRCDVDMQAALSSAVQGDTSLYDQVLANEKGRRSFKTKGGKGESRSMDGGNESDVDSSATMTDGEVENEGLDTKNSSNKSNLYQEMIQAQMFAPPHPRAGGFMKEVPAQLYMVEEKFMGHIMVRVSSKKLFRKWKIMFFVFDTNKISFYESSRQWEARVPPRLSFRMHSLMFICKPTLKNTYSVMDNGKRVYYSVFRENAPTSGSKRSFQMDQAIAKAVKFTPALESRRICKFGAHRSEVISAFAYALHGVISQKVREKQSQQNQDNSGSGYPPHGRYN